MTSQANSASLDTRQSILDAIHALLESPGNGVDETRAKEIRKAVDSLRRATTSATEAEDVAAADDTETDPALDQLIDAGLETLRDKINKQVERRNRDIDRLLQLLEEAETALAGNELQQAEHAHHKLKSIMGGIPGLAGQRLQEIEQRLNQIRPRLRKLESWRHWGTTQARQELINRIRALKDSGLPPDQLANRIRDARTQWQDWDKSGDHAGKELWKEFDAACTEAYQPCIEYFNRLKQQRDENLKQRQLIIEKLVSRYESTDWKHPDWRDIDRFVQQSQRDFHRHGNIDFRHRKATTKLLDEALARFEQHLAREREHSLRVREKLIADIEALANLGNLREALDQLDTLKKHWTITVPGKRGLENRLWKRFQAACDGIYRKRDTERKQQDAERQDNLAKKQALIGELNRAAAATDAELLAGTTLLTRLQENWQDIGTVPRKDEQTLDKHWRNAHQHYRQAIAAAQGRAQAAALDTLAQRAALCRQWEQSVLAGNTIDPAHARAQWDALPALEGDAARAMEQRYQLAFMRPDDATLADNHARAQQACLKLEVLLELPSPPEFQTARMAYQVERLNASLHKKLDAQESVEDLLLTALTTGALPPAAVDAIAQRVEHCLAARRNRS